MPRSCNSDLATGVPAPSRQWHSQPSPPVYIAATRQSSNRDKASIQWKINLLQILKKEVAMGVMFTGFPCSDSREGHWEEEVFKLAFCKGILHSKPRQDS